MLKPRKRRAPLRPIVLSLILIGLIGWTFRNIQGCQSQQARARIEQSLGAHSNEATPVAPQLGDAEPPDLLDDPERLPMGGMPSGMSEGMPNPFGGSGFPSPMDGLSPDGVRLEETANAYRLLVPLADKKDASQVQLKVTAHHLEISGQTGSAPAGSAPGFAMTTSFMQSLDTSQEVLPQKVRREVTEQDGHLTLLITIPKRNPGKKPSLNAPNHSESSSHLPFPTRPISPPPNGSRGQLPDNVF
jgi:hypothetical protein